MHKYEWVIVVCAVAVFCSGSLWWADTLLTRQASQYKQTCDTLGGTVLHTGREFQCLGVAHVR
jgi:hypothetical protein